MDTTLIPSLVVAAAVVAALCVLLFGKEKELRKLRSLLSAREADLIRKEAEVHTAETLRESENRQHEQAMAEIKASQEKAIEAAKTALALENEKLLKAREEALKKEATETMKHITGGLDQTIKGMTEAFEAQKKSHAEETSSIKTQFAETVKHLKEQTEAIGNQAEDLAKAIKGQNKVQGNFGETILENMLREQGFREGLDYESEHWLVDKNGNRIRNEETGKHMRPDFVLHLPDNTDILVDSKMSLTALTDYHAAETDEAREEAATRNLESVRSHIKELTDKEYQKYVVGRKTLDFVIMFIPNYGAWQLAKMKDAGLFNRALEQGVLITTEETLVPFLRLIHGAWMRKEQMENIATIVKSAQEMVERVAHFCEENTRLGNALDNAVKIFKENANRLNGRQSIVGAARKAIDYGVKPPIKHSLPSIDAGESPDEI